MLYRPEDTIFKYQSDLHDRILANCAVPRMRWMRQAKTAFIVLPVVLLSSVLSVDMRETVPSPLVQGRIHAAAPSGRTEEKKDTMGIHLQPVSVQAKEEEIPPHEQYARRQETLGNDEKRPDNHIGPYLTASSMGKEERRLKEMDALQGSAGNAVVFDVKGSFVYFPTDAAIAEEIGSVRPLYDLPAIIREAKDRGIYTVARFIVAKDPTLASRKPETQIENIYGGKGIGDVWVNPGHETTIAYNEQILRDVVASGVDEVNFDYIRYPTEYDQSAIGLSGEQKAERLERFLRTARTVVEEEGNGTKLGISTYAILGWNFPVNFEPLGQDIARFAKLVDVISPMAYPATFAEGAYYDPQIHPGSRMHYLVYQTLMGYKKLLGENAWKLRPWIQGYYVDAQDISDEADAVFDAGLCGFTVWNAKNNYGPLYDALENLDVPETCGEEK